MFQHENYSEQKTNLAIGYIAVRSLDRSALVHVRLCQ
jgi:hypothetical protein